MPWSDKEFVVTKVKNHSPGCSIVYRCSKLSVKTTWLSGHTKIKFLTSRFGDQILNIAENIFVPLVVL